VVTTQRRLGTGDLAAGGIDHIYLTDDLSACATGCAIDKSGSGQHRNPGQCPVVVILASGQKNDNR